MNSNIVLRVALAGAIGFGLVGCMHTSSGVIPMDKGTYYISQDDSRLGMGPPGVETISAVYKEANEFCSKKNKEVERVNNIYTDSGFAKRANFSLEFRCIDLKR